MTSHPWVSRSIPFALYMLFIALQGVLEPVVSEEFSAVYFIPVLYAVKTFVVIISLVVLWDFFDELTWPPAVNLANLIVSIITGVVVFVLWINMDWSFATMGGVKSYDPSVLPHGWIYPFIFIRLLGASVVVPIFEELFWRSFILRYIINPDFSSVKLGTFTLSSFIVSSILFGLEHNLWLAGIMAGVFYNVVLYRTKNLYYCILAHGITNFLLGVYVVKTGNWQFW